MDKKQNQDFELRLIDLEKSYISLLKEIKNLVNIESFVAENKVCEKDKIWVCEKCKFKLAVIDVNNKEVRIRHKDLYLWNKMDKGGEIKIICRGCSHLNTLFENDIIN